MQGVPEGFKPYTAASRHAHYPARVITPFLRRKACELVGSPADVGDHSSGVRELAELLVARQPDTWPSVRACNDMLYRIFTGRKRTVTEAQLDAMACALGYTVPELVGPGVYAAMLGALDRPEGVPA